MPKLTTMIAHVISNAVESDFLLISGIALVNVICVVTWLSKFDTINVLNWVPDDNNVKDGPGRYVPTTFKKQELWDLMSALQTTKPVEES